MNLSKTSANSVFWFSAKDFHGLNHFKEAWIGFYNQAKKINKILSAASVQTYWCKPWNTTKNHLLCSLFCVSVTGHGRPPLHLQWDNWQYRWRETWGWLLARYLWQREAGRCGISSAWEQHSTVGLRDPPAPSSFVSCAPALAFGAGNDWWSLAWISAALPTKTRNILFHLTEHLKPETPFPTSSQTSALRESGLTQSLKVRSFTTSLRNNG